jgi:hypothetical protein
VSITSNKGSRPKERRGPGKEAALTLWLSMQQGPAPDCSCTANSMFLLIAIGERIAPLAMCIALLPLKLHPGPSRVAGFCLFLTFWKRLTIFLQLFFFDTNESTPSLQERNIQLTPPRRPGRRAQPPGQTRGAKRFLQLFQPRYYSCNQLPQL